MPDFRRGEKDPFAGERMPSPPMRSNSPLMKPLFTQRRGLTKSPRLERNGQDWGRVSPLSSGVTPTLAAGLSISCEAAFGWGSRAGVPRASSAEAAVTMADAGGGDRQSVGGGTLGVFHNRSIPNRRQFEYV